MPANIYYVFIPLRGGEGGGGDIVARTDHIDMIKCRFDVEA